MTDQSSFGKGGDEEGIGRDSGGEDFVVMFLDVDGNY